MANKHSFHIPVMGIGFTVDSALKVAHYGIDSVLSLSGHKLHEKLRKLYSDKNGISYEEISEKVEDYKAKRTTAYLNLLADLTAKKIENFKNFPEKNKDQIEKYFDLLPDGVKLKSEFNDLMASPFNSEKYKKWANSNLIAGSIDVNIMTKLDRENYLKGEKLPPEQNDAHVALRGYANSKLSSSLVLSAGLNPRLFTYMEQFEDFYPDESGHIKKKIILKVSDYRSALIQGKYLAKKGLWVAEYRIESGLNCGGHAFATEGYLMGPILAEFKNNKTELFNSVFDVLETALIDKNRPVSKATLTLNLTAQGGVGTSEEHQFLLDEYQLNSIGWGSPLLLVPEATNVDSPTMTRLMEAEEEDFFLSDISPLGVPFNSLKGTTKEKERQERVLNGKPGSPCIEGNLALFNTEFTDKPVCTASRQYQNLKIKDLNQAGLSPEDYKKEFDKVVAKTCLCTGLVTSVLSVNDLESIAGNDGAAICPGPNMAYFKNILTLKEMTDHIYGRKNIVFNTQRPHMFIKELYAYMKYLTNAIEGLKENTIKKEKNRLVKFSGNLSNGINYYFSLFNTNMNAFSTTRNTIIEELGNINNSLQKLHQKITDLTLVVS